MKLQTNIPFSRKPLNQIDYQSKTLLLGSCFVENIGQKLDYFKFQSLQNPFGILFHPLAIEKLVTNAINQKEYTKADVFKFNEQWHCYDAHSKLSSHSKEQLLNDLNNALDLTYQQFNDSSHIIITLGTAWVYRHIETDEIVANCHKIPQKKFSKELLPLDAITEALEAVINLIRSINTNVKFIFTVSPVRHLKDGFVENNQSKAHLISAVHQVVEPRKGAHYFPSYEIMMDELRDYRFYAEDMIHPSQIAINYIWERFKDVWIKADAYKTMDDIDTIQKGLLHRPFNPDCEEHKSFIKDLTRKQKVIQANFPNINF